MAQSAPDPASELSVPPVESSDSEEVARALKLAQMLWEEGQQKEAIRTLQRGAAAAEQDGNDLRALVLARTAADLSAHVALSASPPVSVEVDVEPPSAGPMALSPASPPSASPVPAEAPSPAAAPAPTPAPAPVSPSTSAPAPASLSASAPAAAKSTRPLTGAPRPPLKSEAPAPVAVSPSDHPPASVAPITVRTDVPIPPAAIPGSEVPLPAAAFPSSPQSSPNSMRGSALGRGSSVPNAVERHSAKPIPRTTNGSSSQPFPVQAREVRVSVKRSALDDTLLVVRPLAPGARLPAGAREATLIFSESEGE